MYLEYRKIYKTLQEDPNNEKAREKYGEYPTKEYIVQELEADDFGEFTHDEMHEMIKKCYERE